MSRGRLVPGTYEPFPDRALDDKRLTVRDCRVIIAVAHFDRGGVNGRGCTAGLTAIAEKARLDRADTSRTLKRLVERGHLVRKEGGRGRATEYSVVYECDISATNEVVVPSPTSGGSENAIYLKPKEDFKQKQPLSNPGSNVPKGVTAIADDVFSASPAREEAFSSGARPGNLVVDADVATAWEENPGINEDALHADDVIGMKLLTTSVDAAFIARLDREIRNGRRFRSDIADRLYERVEAIFNEYDAHTGDSIGGRAYRLLETDFCRETA